MERACELAGDGDAHELERDLPSEHSRADAERRMASRTRKRRVRGACTPRKTESVRLRVADGREHGLTAVGDETVRVAAGCSSSGIRATMMGTAAAASTSTHNSGGRGVGGVREPRRLGALVGNRLGSGQARRRSVDAGFAALLVDVRERMLVCGVLAHIFFFLLFWWAFAWWWWLRWLGAGWILAKATICDLCGGRICAMWSTGAKRMR